MLKDLFINSSILISFLFLGGEIFKDTTLSPSAPLKIRVFGGIVSGLLGSILMIFSVRISPEIVLDLRHFAIIIVAIYGGLSSSIITALIIAAFRIYYFPIGSLSITAGSIIVLLGIISGLISQLNTSQKRKWLYMNIVNMAIISTDLLLAAKENDLVLESTIYFIMMSIITGLLVYHFSNYITVSNSLYKKFKIEATQDFLTGLNNVRSFDNKLNDMITKLDKNKEDLSIIILDIDHFKRINDTYGHVAGDYVLKELAKVLSSSCRDLDIVSRTGGEEFCILLPDCPNKKAIAVAERIRTNVEKHQFVLSDQQKINITVSLGITTYPDKTTNLNSIVEEADYALYQAKQTGRNRVCTG
ncbi:diguanylate cyclase [Orenia metallireducens]|uniref:Diguanylate cyclase n=1 Tax=Orenia metallireducens TaxID=1413210 RepID=A0A285HJA1_9FIRM|nr:diguanylate cyclase [Orenia metallireducens]PRX26643.1 diguanylate cyclase [Orenia metallireducens]SNY35798.1 diguanylate cyclase [Orenia metallireducens]